MKYRKPRSLNWVTFMLLGVVGLIVYASVYMWPVYSTKSRVKGILLDQVPALYKANLRSDAVASEMIEEIKTNIRKEMEKAGIKDKAVKIFVRRNPKVVELEARFKVKARFPWPDRTFEFELAPTVISDATRVDW
jgi:hypothetical protein